MTRLVQVPPPFADFPMIREIGPSRAAVASAALAEHRNRGIEICYIHTGHHDWQVEDRSYRLSPGDGFVTLPWQRHGGEHGVRQRGRLEYVVIAPARCTPDRGWQWGAWCPLDREARDFVQRTLLDNLSAQVDRAHELAPLFARLRDELAATRPGRRSMVHALLAEMLVTTARLVHWRQVRVSDDERLRACFARVRDDLDRRWTLAELARLAGLRRSRFAELVRDRYGCSPLQQVEQMRIDVAKAALAYGSQPITRIALDLGFASSQYFATVFKRAVGLSPRAFRRQARS